MCANVRFYNTYILAPTEFGTTSSGPEIGKGQFAVVHAGIYKDTLVAVKHQVTLFNALAHTRRIHDHTQHPFKHTNSQVRDAQELEEYLQREIQGLVAHLSDFNPFPTFACLGLCCGPRFDRVPVGDGRIGGVQPTLVPILPVCHSVSYPPLNPCISIRLSPAGPVLQSMSHPNLIEFVGMADIQEQDTWNLYVVTAFAKGGSQIKG